MEKSKYNKIKMNSLRVDKLLLDKNDKLKLYCGFDNKCKRITFGCGICEDCGGIWDLEDLIKDEKNDWEYHIDDFDINEINAMLDKYYN